MQATNLPGEEPPYLLVLQDMRYHLNVEKMLGVGNANEDGGSNDAEEHASGDGGIGEA